LHWLCLFFDDGFDCVPPTTQFSHGIALLEFVKLDCSWSRQGNHSTAGEGRTERGKRGGGTTTTMIFGATRARHRHH